MIRATEGITRTQINLNRQAQITPGRLRLAGKQDRVCMRARAAKIRVAQLDLGGKTDYLIAWSVIDCLSSQFLAAMTRGCA